MNRLIAVTTVWFFLVLPIQALDVSGMVRDKFGNPLPGARICLQGTARCVESGIDGAFRYSDAAASLRRMDAGRMDASLFFRPDGITLVWPGETEARLQWFSSPGAALGSPQPMRLRKGGNRISLPEPLLTAGPAYLQVSGPGVRVTWRIFAGLSASHRTAVASGARAESGEALSPSAAAGKVNAAVAAKVSAAVAALEILKDRYKPAVYAPAKEIETQVAIELRPAGDRILFNGANLDAWNDFSNGAWKIVGGAVVQNGGSGALHTRENFGDFRLVTTSRKPGGSHNPNFLLWCKPGSTDKRTLGGIQFQPPLGHMWDYVANKDPKSLGTMTRVGSTADLKVDQWARCESLTKVSTATIRFACCNLEEGRKTCDAAEIVRFTDPKFARSGPIALMIHDDGQRQEYRDIEIETDPIEPDRLLSVKGR